MTSEWKNLYELSEEIEIAMMTPRRPGGHLDSRAMANQIVAAGVDPWFVRADSEMLKGWATGDKPDIGEMHPVAEPHR